MMLFPRILLLAFRPHAKRENLSFDCDGFHISSSMVFDEFHRDLYLYLLREPIRFGQDERGRTTGQSAVLDVLGVPRTCDTQRKNLSFSVRNFTALNQSLIDLAETRIVVRRDTVIVFSGTLVSKSDQTYSATQLVLGPFIDLDDQLRISMRNRVAKWLSAIKTTNPDSDVDVLFQNSGFQSLSTFKRRLAEAEEELLLLIDQRN